MPDFTLQQTGAELQNLINKIAPTEEKVTQLESKTNKIVYTNSPLWNSFFKELYLDKNTLGDELKLYIVRRGHESNNWQISFANYNNTPVAVYSSDKEEQGVLWIKQSGVIVGYAVVNWDVLTEPYAKVVDEPILSNAFIPSLSYDNYKNITTIDSRFKTYAPLNLVSRTNLAEYIQDIYVENAGHEDITITYVGYQKQGEILVFLVQIKSDKLSASNYLLEQSKVKMGEICQLRAESSAADIYKVYVRFAENITDTNLYTCLATITDLGKDVNNAPFLENLKKSAKSCEQNISNLQDIVNDLEETYVLSNALPTQYHEFAKKYIKDIYVAGRPNDVLSNEYAINYVGVDTIFGAGNFGIQLCHVPFDSSKATNYYIPVASLSAGAIVKLTNTSPLTMNEDVYIRVPDDYTFVQESQWYGYDAPSKNFTITNVGKLLTSAMVGEKVVELFSDKYKVKDEITYIVDVNGSGDFVSLRDCLDTIYANGERFSQTPINKEYIVKILPGVYDVRSYYTQEEWDAEGFVGLNVPRGVALIGMGKKREDVLITCTSETAKGSISTLNFIDDVRAENLTIYAENIRYTIHDDYSYYPYSNKYGSYRRIKDVDFIGKDLTNMSVYGSGTHGGADWQFENVRFIANYPHSNVRAFSVHDRTVSDCTKAEHFKFINCEFITYSGISIALNPLDGGVEQNVEFVGCTFYKIIIEATSSYPASGKVNTIYNVKGCGNSKGYVVEYTGDIEQAKKSTPKFSDDSYIGVNVGNALIAFGDYVKYQKGALIKSTENDYDGIATRDCGVGEIGAIRIKS